MYTSPPSLYIRANPLMQATNTISVRTKFLILEMSKLITANKKKNGIVQLKFAAKKLQKSLLRGKKLSEPCRDDAEEGSVPEDVKEGHFAVVAVDGEEPKRFVAPLSCLTHPTFLRLLEQAAEEFGFDHEGALTIPCSPSELERVLAEQWEEKWGLSKTMVRSF